MIKHKAMATLQVSPSSPVARIKKASRLLRPGAPRKAQVRLEEPRVFCDPRMPGGWHELRERVAGEVRAA